MSDSPDTPQGGRMPPPTKQDVIWEWFLGEARELFEDIKAAGELSRENREALEALLPKLREQLGEIRDESIQAQRDIQRAVKTAEDTLARASRAGVSDIDARLRQGTTRIAVTAAIAGGAGAAIGGLIVAIAVPLIR